MPTGRPQHEPIRWSAFMAGMEFGVTVNKVKAGLRQLGISPGKDGKFTTKEIADALFRSDGLEKKAKEARWQNQIDEAKASRLARERLEESLLDVEVAREFMTDLTTTYVSLIRHNTKLTDSDKKQMIKQITEIKFRSGKNGSTKKSGE